MRTALAPHMTLRDGALRASVLVLLALAALHLGWGFFQLVAGHTSSAAIDMRYRWLEGRYFLERQSLVDLARLIDPRPPELTHGPVSPNYPPWSFVTGLAAAPPIPFQAARIWMALLDVAALATVALFAWRSLRRLGPWAAALGAAAVLAPVANLFTVSAGQYGLLVNALVVATMTLDAKGRWFWAGVCFGLALIKPSYAGLFALVLLVQGSWRPLAVAAAIVLVEGAFALAWLRTGPIEFADQLRLAVPALYGLGYSPLAFVVRAGGDGSRWVPFIAGAGFLLALWLLVRRRDASLCARLAIAAVLGRLWTYHNAYDNVMLVFLPLALFQLALERSRVDVPLVAVLAVVCVSLFAPVPWVALDSLRWLQAAHLVSWAAGLAVVVARTPRLSAARADASIAFLTRDARE